MTAGYWLLQLKEQSHCNPENMTSLVWNVRPCHLFFQNFHHTCKVFKRKKKEIASKPSSCRALEEEIWKRSANILTMMAKIPSRQKLALGFPTAVFTYFKKVCERWGFGKDSRHYQMHHTWLKSQARSKEQASWGCGRSFWHVREHSGWNVLRHGST